MSSCSWVHLFPTTINSEGVEEEVGDLKYGDNWEGEDRNGVYEFDRFGRGDLGLIEGETTIFTIILYIYDFYHNHQLINLNVV